MKFKAACAALLVAAASPLCAQQTSPYAGQERNEIKALSAQEVKSLQSGHGMGYAKAAELNGYPGPMHVIELAEQLALTPAQLEASKRLMNEHRTRARELGAELINAERTLNTLFAQRRADADAVAVATEQVGVQQARLRAEHLNTHLQQTALLNAGQIRRYSELRGYGSASAQPHQPRSHSK